MSMSLPDLRSLLEKGSCTLAAIINTTSVRLQFSLPDLTYCEYLLVCRVAMVHPCRSAGVT